MALKSGCEGVSAINTIMSVMGIDLNTLRPEPCVEGLVNSYLTGQIIASLDVINRFIFSFSFSFLLLCTVTPRLVATLQGLSILLHLEKLCRLQK